MRIAITSDIHFHRPWRDRFERFAELLTEYKPDLLILAGDLGEPLDMFEYCLEFFKPICEQRAALAGNHDVWHRAATYTSQQLWESELEAVAGEHAYCWLDRRNISFGLLGICGTVGWYDYSGKHPEVALSDNEYENLKRWISNDGRYIDWPWSDREFAKQVGAEFQERLDALEHDPQITDVVVVTHVPLYADCVKHTEGPEKGIANAYYVNLPLGEQVNQREKVRAIFSGHIHREVRSEAERPDGTPLAIYTVPADYGKPAALLLETETWEVEALKIEVATAE